MNFIKLELRESKFSIYSADPLITYSHVKRRKQIVSEEVRTSFVLGFDLFITYFSLFHFIKSFRRFLFLYKRFLIFYFVLLSVIETKLFGLSKKFISKLNLFWNQVILVSTMFLWFPLPIAIYKHWWICISNL